jgi:5-formyltetrahydrofolate cyclo-ligase
VPDFSAKAAIRAARLAARRAMPSGVRAQADAALRAALVALVRTRQPDLITGYVPMPGEPGGADLPQALDSALARPGRLLLPVLLPDLDLDWAAYTDSTDLHAARAGLREPTGARLGTSAIAGAGLVVVPAVAVDQRGVRLGRGGGSYDRALDRVAPDALVVALLYDDELVDVLPAEEHDRRVNAVVTPSGGVHRTGSG